MWSYLQDISRIAKDARGQDMSGGILPNRLMRVEIENFLAFFVIESFNMSITI